MWERTPRVQNKSHLKGAQCDTRAISGWTLTMLRVRRRAHDDLFPSTVCVRYLSLISTAPVDGAEARVYFDEEWRRCDNLFDCQ